MENYAMGTSNGRSIFESLKMHAFSWDTEDEKIFVA